MNGAVTMLQGSMDEIAVNPREALRYLAIQGETPPALEPLFARAHNVLRGAAAPRACFARLPLQMQDDLLEFGAFRLQSRALAKNLAGCSESFLFAATLGFGVDRLLLRLQRSEPSFALVFDAWCSAAAEGWCDAVNARLAEGEILRPRFSPGYGDVPLSLQRDVLAALDAQRKLGITLSDTYFMTPCKSVTAFVGISGS